MTPKMKTIILKISDHEVSEYNIQSHNINFGELVKKIKIKIAKEALLTSQNIAEQKGLSKMTDEEINAEIEGVRNAKNNH